MAQAARASVKSNRKIRSFTLVEIILVVLILSIVAGLAVPNFSRAYEQILLKKSTEDLAYLMRYAQSRAVIKNKKMRLEFDESLSKYWLTQESAEGSSADQEQAFQRIPSSVGRSFLISDKIKLEMTGSPILFFPDGQIDQLRVYLCQEEKCRTISTQEQRGRVRVFDSKLQ